MNHNERQAWVTVLDRDDTGPPAYLYDLSPIGESRIARYIPAMTKPFTLLTSAASLFAFLILAPTARSLCHRARSARSTVSPIGPDVPGPCASAHWKL